MNTNIRKRVIATAFPEEKDFAWQKGYGAFSVKLLVENEIEVTCLVRSPDKIKQLKPLGIKVVTRQTLNNEYNQK